METVIIVLSVITTLGMGVVLLGVFSLFGTLSRFNEYNINNTANSNHLLQRINKIELDIAAINEVVRISKTRIENTLERMWKLESMLTHVLSTTQNFMVGLEQLAGEVTPTNIQLNRPDGRIIQAQSMEEFLRKIQGDPAFRNMTPEQLEELRKMFEQNLNEEDNDDEPWKEE